VLFFRWLKLAYPKQYESIFAIPNGGYRTIRTAASLRDEGVKAGVPDICFPFLRQSKNITSGALYIEMKRQSFPGKPKGLLSLPQKNIILRLLDNSNTVRLCYGWEEATEAVRGYLSFDAEVDYPLYDERLAKILGLVIN
jgi:hypothetical protein